MIISDKNAFKQALGPFAKEYTVIRCAKPGYNERGRVDNTKIKVTINAAVVPENRSLGTDQEGLGRRVTSSYGLYCVLPDYVSLGDLILTEYGTLKVVQLPDEGYQGVIHASLIRAGTTESNQTTPNKLYDDD